MSWSDEAKDAIFARSGETAVRRPEEPAPPEATAPSPEHRTDQRSEACQTEPVAIPSVPDVPPSSIDTDVRRHGLNPILTGVTIGIIAIIIGFLLGFAYLVVSYVRYTNG